MRILLATWGTEGDTRPLLALAKGLQAAGHEPLVLADRAGAAAAARLGVDFEAMPGDFRALMEGGGATGEMMRRGRSAATTWNQLGRDFAAPAMQRLLELMDGGMDLLVGSSMLRIPAEIIARRTGLPAVGLDLFPMTTTREFPPSLLGITSLPRQLNRPLYWAMNAAFAAVDAAYLSPRIPKRATASRVPIPLLGGWSPTLLPRPADWPTDRPEVVGELRLEDSQQPLPDDVLDFLAAGDAPVFVGLGSMAGADLRHFRETALAALDGRRAVFSAGWNDFGGIDFPETVLPIGPANFAELFPRCSVLVHHGGAGTAHLAARSGRPSVIVPQIADQAFWAAQFLRLGISGGTLGRDTVSVDDFRAALQRADACTARATAIGQRMQPEDGVRATVTRLEQVLAGLHR